MLTLGRICSHCVDGLFDDCHNLVPFSLDRGEHGIDTIRKTARPDDPNGFGDDLAHFLPTPSGVTENATSTVHSLYGSLRSAAGPISALASDWCPTLIDQPVSTTWTPQRGAPSSVPP